MTLLPRHILLLLAAPVILEAGETLVVGTTNAPPDSVVLTPLTVQKTDPVVAVQFQVNYPTSHVEAGTPSVEGSSDHAATGLDDQAGVMKVVVYSITNAEIPADIKIQVPLNLLANSPGGGPSVTLSNITFTDVLGNGFSSSVVYTLIETWRQTNFTPAQLANPLVVGDNGNPDFDELPNLLELLMGKNPNVPDFGVLPPVSIETETGKTYLRLRFNLLKDVAIRAAAPVGGQVSPDLVNWTDTGVTVTPTGVQDVTTEEVEAEFELTGEAKKFLRITGARGAGN